jgi:catechol 2,3-dioxygenase-like lactoylglutathione lyase family enzyme
MFRFDHLHIVCQDLPVLGAFLTDILGAKELRRAETLKNWEYSIDGIKVLVRQRQVDEPLGDGDIRREGIDHLGLRVPEIAAACQYLVEAGCVLREGPTRVRGNLSTAFLMAPGGLLIELLQRD